MLRPINQLPTYQQKMIAEAGLTEQRLIALCALLNESWENIKNKPVSEALRQFTTYNVSPEEAFTLFTIFFTIIKK